MRNIIYLDDVRTPINADWIVVRNYDQFVSKVNELGIENIELISLDHDLGPSAMREYYNNVSPNYTLDYNNITEKTGYDCLKWLVEQCLNNPPANYPKIVTHSANPVGSANIMGYCNNFYMNVGLEQSCIRVKIEHKV